MRNLLKIVFTAIIGLIIHTEAFAESAPVYDADSLQQQFESSGDQGEELPLPPSPTPDQERAFVPVTPQSQASPAAAAPAVSSGGGQSSALSQRVAQLEQQIENLQTPASSSRIEALQKEIQTLRGQVEQLEHQLQQVQNQQKNMYTDLDKRLQQNANAPKSAKSSSDDVAIDDAIVKRKSPPKTAKSTEQTTSATEDQPNVAEEQQVYQTAYNLIKAKKYNEAVVSLQNMLQKYPSGQFAANAHYWLGDLYNVMGKNDQALAEFIIVTKNYPDSPRVSDAQLKVGLLYASQSKWSEAKAAFKKVISRYPGTASSRLANEQLKQIKQAGH